MAIVNDVGHELRHPLPPCRLIAQSSHPHLLKVPVTIADALVTMDLIGQLDFSAGGSDGWGGIFPVHGILYQHIPCSPRPTRPFCAFNMIQLTIPTKTALVVTALLHSLRNLSCSSQDIQPSLPGALLLKDPKISFLPLVDPNLLVAAKPKKALDQYLGLHSALSSATWLQDGVIRWVESLWPSQELHLQSPTLLTH